MQPLGASSLLQQLACKAPGSWIQCAAACQVPLGHCLDVLQQQHQHELGIEYATAQHLAEQLSNLQLQHAAAGPAALRPLVHFTPLCQQQQQQQQIGLMPYHMQLFRHYRSPPRAAARSARHHSSESDMEVDMLDSLAPSHTRPNHRQQRQQQYKQPYQQQRQQLQLRRQQQSEEDDLVDVQQQWRQQWQHLQQQQQRQGHSRESQYNRGGSRRVDVSPIHRGRAGSDATSSSRSNSSSRTSRFDPSSSPQSSDNTTQGVALTTPKKQQQQQSLDALGVTRAISAASSLQELQKLLQQHSEYLQQIHVCAAYKAVVRLAVGLRDRDGTHSQPASSSSSSSTSPSSDNTTTTSSSTPSSSSSSSVQKAPVDGSTALDVLRTLSKRLQQQIRVARPWDLAQAAWACSKLQFRDEKLLQAIAQQAQRKAAILTPQDISQLASAYARLSYNHPQLFKLLATQAKVKAADFAPWALVHTAWALHTGGQGVQEVLGAVVEVLGGEGVLQQLKELDMSTLLWLMAGHSVFDEQLLHSAAAHVAANIGSYTPASVANTLMAFAALGFSTPPLTEAAAAAVLSGLQQQQQRYRPHHVAHSVYALSRLQSCSPQLLEATAAVFTQEPQAYAPSHLSMLVWVGVLNRQQGLPAGFMRQVMQSSTQKMQDFSGDQLASLLRGLAAPAHVFAQDHTSSVQDGSAAARLLAEAVGVLPEKLPAVSTNVLTELIKSLGRRARAVQQQQQQQELSMQVPGTRSPSSLSTEGAAVPGEHASLAQLLQACVTEWARSRRVGQITHWQAQSVVGALEGAGLEELAAGAKQVSKAILKAQEVTQQPQGSSAAVHGDASRNSNSSGSSSGSSSSGGHVEPQGGVAPSTWVDSFVASTK